MAYDVIILPLFNRQAKRLVKKYPSFRIEIAHLIDSLKANPTQGTSLGMNCYKIRLSISSKGKGKSGGARVITHLHIAGDTIILMNLYDKAEQSNISISALKEQLKSIYNS